MWASRPFYSHHGAHDDDMMPMDLRKIRREEDADQILTPTVFAPRENLLDLSRKRWLPPPPDHERGGALESTIRRLHQSSQLKKAPEPTKEERCRSTDTILGSKESSSSLEGSSKRSNSCPDLTVILPTPPPPRPLKPSPIKPKSSFIQRSISSTTNDPSHTTTGAKKRKSFVPAYGDPSPKRRPPSPMEHHSPYDDYYSHPEVLLRRQLQEPPPYLLHVYDYYQQLVQRLRENSNVRCMMPPPVSPTSIEDEILVQGGDVNRKRPCRALTGKHVRQGTGASISTLLTLRQKIQERQKAKEHQPRSVFLCNKNGKKGKQQMKAKENALKAYC